MTPFSQPIKTIHLPITIGRPPAMEEYTLQLKPPSVASLASSLNRLLRCTNPASRNRNVFTRWLNQHWASPLPTKDFTQQLPIETLEHITHCWLIQAFAHHQTAVPTPIANPWLSQYFLSEELDQANPLAWLRADLTCLKEHRHPDLHPSHYTIEHVTSSDRNILCSILTHHGFLTEHLDVLANALTHPPKKPPTPTELSNAYLHDRTLSQPFPWALCFNALLDQTELQPSHWRNRYPHLNYGLQVYQTFCQHHGLFGNTPEESTLRTSIHTQWKATETFQAVRPIHHWVLVEGVTETMILPQFAHMMGVHSAAYGVHWAETGGKKPMLTKLHDIQQYYDGPITLILDADAEEARSEFEALLNPTKDALYFLPEGTLEDTYPDHILLKTINTHYHPVRPLTDEDLAELREEIQADGKELTQIRLLKRLFNTYELETNADKPTQGFDKVAFARNIAACTQRAEDIPHSLQTIIIERLRPLTQQVKPTQP